MTTAMGAREASLRRILVALDGSPPSLEALAVAVRLAAVLEAELHGLFIEDTDVLSFAELPFAALTGVWSDPSRQLRDGDLQRGLRLQAQRAREAMLQAAGGAGLRWSFAVLRGNVPRVLLEAAAEADLLSLGLLGVSVSHRGGGGSLARTAAHAAPGPVLLARHGLAPGAPVVILLGAWPRAVALLQRAALLAQTQQRQLVVVLPAPPPEREGVVAQALEVVAPWRVAVRFVELDSEDPVVVWAELLRRARGGLLVLDLVGMPLEPAQLDQLVDRGGCSLLLLRGDRRAR